MALGASMPQSLYLQRAPFSDTTHRKLGSSQVCGAGDMPSYVCIGPTAQDLSSCTQHCDRSVMVFAVMSYLLQQRM
ncbi:hypothetical protein Naga_100055g11 [Nannochloropsis gaditana]|uniref:Uncharacterized protein n=1 Tax=Nannochloropsis gaditana TaxID=72520 RepID=W7TVM2_9STRA|nr:hypothetical protein Naga_100055g11 [Nannochloropsis gaditana]